MKDRYYKDDCIFCSTYRDHGASVKICTRYDLCLPDAIDRFSSCCPCNAFITCDIVADLQNCGDLYYDYSRLLR